MRIVNAQNHNKDCPMRRLTPEMYPLLLAIMAACTKNMPPNTEACYKFTDDLFHALEDIIKPENCEVLDGFTVLAKQLGPLNAFLTAYENAKDNL